jgi:hypothetical protein
VDLPRLREGGVDAQFFACYVPVPYQRHGAVTHALERLDEWHLLAERQPDRFVLARCADDILRAKAAGQIAGIAGLGGGSARWQHWGAAPFLPAGNPQFGRWLDYRNAACDGVAENRSKGGLTEFGCAGGRGVQPSWHPARCQPSVPGWGGGRARRQPSACHRQPQQRLHALRPSAQPDRCPGRGDCGGGSGWWG